MERERDEGEEAWCSLSPHSQRKCLMTSCSLPQTSDGSTDTQTMCSLRTATIKSWCMCTVTHTHTQDTKCPLRWVYLYRPHMYKEHDLSDINNKWCTQCSSAVILFLETQCAQTWYTNTWAGCCWSSARHFGGWRFKLQLKPSILGLLQ